ncbi:MAG: hypothetical protein ACM37V_15550 [Gemmatimonadota bacterium]
MAHGQQRQRPPAPSEPRPGVGYAAHGESGLADQVLSFISKLTPAQREAAAKVIGEVLPGLWANAAQAGELWLRDAEITSWRIVFAAERRNQRQEQRERFFKAWRNA